MRESGEVPVNIKKEGKKMERPKDAKSLNAASKHEDWHAMRSSSRSKSERDTRNATSEQRGLARSKEFEC